MLSAHYRSPINFSKDLMESAKSSLGRIYTCIENLEFLSQNAQNANLRDSEEDSVKTLSGYKDKFIAAMDDDLNTADAISAIFEIVSYANKNIDSDSSKELIEKYIGTIKELGDILGLLQKSQSDVPAEIQSILDERAAARAEKNWGKSDELRDKLKELGYIVKDTKQGQQLTKA